MYCLTSIRVHKFTSHIRPGRGSRLCRCWYSCFTSIQLTIHLHQVTKIAFQLHSSPISPYPDLMMCVSTQTRQHLILIQVSGFASHLNPGSISTPSSYEDVRLTSIQFPSHRHPSPKIHASPTSRSCLTLTHALIFASHIHLSDVSSPSRSWKLHLSSIQVQSQTHPGLEMCISIPSRSCTTCITSRLPSIQTTFHLNICPDICIPHPPRSRKLHPNSILVPSHRIQVSWCAPQLNPGPISAPPKCRYLCFTRSASHFQRGSFSPASRSQDSRLSSIQVPSHSHSSLKICIQTPSMFSPSPIYIQVTSHINPGPNICISHPSRWCLLLMCVTHPSRSCLTCIQIPISLSNLHPCTVSPPSRSEVSCLVCIHVTSPLQPTHFHSSHDICITAPPMSYLTPIHVSILAPELHPDHVSPPSRSHD